MSTKATIKRSLLYLGCLVFTIAPLSAASGSVAGATGTGVTELRAYNSFNHAVDGARVSIDQSWDGGDPFDDVWDDSPSTGSLNYEDKATHKAVRIGTGSTEATRYVEYNSSTLGDSNTSLYGAVNLYFTAYPSKNLNVMDFRGNGKRVGSVRIKSTGYVTICYGNQICADVTNTKIALNQWIRLEGRATTSSSLSTADGILAVKQFNVASDTTPTASTSMTNVQTETLTMGGIRFGQTNALTDISNFWIENVRASKSWPGPYVLPGTPTYDTENFEGSSLGYMNRAVSYGFETSGSNVISGSSSVAFNAIGQQSFAEMTQAVHGAGKRYADVTVKYKYTGTSPITSNQPVLTIRNTNSVLYGGGGHLNIWANAATGTFKGDLQAANAFDSGTSGVYFVPGNTYTVRAAVAYMDDHTSRAKVWIDGTQVADITSTTDSASVEADFLRSIVLGSVSSNSQYKAVYDDLEVTAHNSSQF